MTKFIDYLRDVHAKSYSGLDDDMPDHFENWLGDLRGEEYLKREAEADLRALNN